MPEGAMKGKWDLWQPRSLSVRLEQRPPGNLPTWHGEQDTVFAI